MSNIDRIASVAVEFAAEVYSINEIKKAAYRVSDRVAVDIVPSQRTIVCTLRFHKNLTQSEADAVANDFRVEVLDQDLRRIVARETEAVRNAILSYAFSKTGLQEDE